MLRRNPPLLRVHDHQLPFSSLLNTKMIKISFFVCMESFIFGNEVCETPIICSKSSPNLCVLQVRVLASPQLLQPQVARRHHLQPGKAAKISKAPPVLPASNPLRASSTHCCGSLTSKPYPRHKQSQCAAIRDLLSIFATIQ